MKIKTPILWLTKPIRNKPDPWHYFKVEGVMVNAYEILTKPSITKRIIDEGVHKYMGFDGLIVMDSGGFLFMNKKKINVNPETIIDLYEKSKPNYAVVLDHPLLPNLPPEEINKRLEETLENTKIMLELKQSKNPVLIPVIHGFDKTTIKKYIRKLQDIGDFDVYGLGSLVPFVFSTKGNGGIYNLIEIVSLVRALLPDKIIHVFGVGSALTMHLMFYIGVDSVDTVSWRIKAAYGAIQLPGISDRYITPRMRHKKYASLSKEEEKILEKCNCPACRKEGIEGLIKSFKLRALHNAWVYQKEIEKTRRLMKDGEYEKYVESILSKNVVFAKALRYASIMKRKIRTILHE
jgi:tRNA-guanine family transglycosylase